MLARETSYIYVGDYFAEVRTGVDSRQMRQRRYLTGLCAAWVVPLHERHDGCGAGRLDHTEDKQQNNHERYS